MVDADVGLLDDAGEEVQFIIIAGGTFEFDGNAGDDKKDIPFFEFAVTDAALAEEFGTAHLEEGKVVGVMEEAHGIAFDVSDSEGEVGFAGVRGGRSGGLG